MSETYNCEKKEGKLLYKIGLFSQISKITVKALRYYDEMDLLKPEFIDETNGYRYYTSEQLPRINEIISLRQMGMSLDEIKKILNGKSAHEVLQNKKAELLREIGKKTMELSKVEYYLSYGSENEEYHVIIKDLPEVIVASMRTSIKDYNSFFTIYPEMGKDMELRECICSVPNYCFSIYHDGEYKEQNIDIEICEAVTEMKEDTEKVKFKTIYAVETAACTYHKGPYSELRKAYAALMKWIENNGYEMVDNPRESYIDGIWNKDNEEEWLTEIQIPVKKKEII